jgi:muramidase (phage lysozyme)
MAVITAAEAGGESLVRFLDLVAFSEGTSANPLTVSVSKRDGYDVIVSGVDGPEIFTDFSDHPFAHGRPAKFVRSSGLRSTAAGRYQLLLRFWRAYQPMLHLADFSPLSQDKVALRQIAERHADKLILEGKLEEAIAACSPIWASMPGNDYGQGGKSLEALLGKWAEGTQV